MANHMNEKKKLEDYLTLKINELESSLLAIKDCQASIWKLTTRLQKNEENISSMENQSASNMGTLSQKIEMINNKISDLSQNMEKDRKKILSWV